MGDGVDYGQEECYDIEDLEFNGFNAHSLADEYLRLYNKAKAAKVGSDILCPVCAAIHKKTTYHKVFDKKSCKDTYWNTVDENRRDRAKFFSR